MQYQIATDTENGGPVERVEAASLQEALNQVPGEALQVTIGPPGRRIPVLGAFDGTPGVFDRPALRAMLCEDCLSHLRRLIREGEVEGRAGWFGWSVPKASLLAWAGRYARERLKALPIPQPGQSESSDDEEEEGEYSTNWPLGMGVFPDPKIPERDWTDEQLRELWALNFIPCGEQEGTLVLADFGNIEERGMDGDFLSAIFDCPVSTVVLADDPEENWTRTLALWDAFWQCSDTAYLQRPHPADDEPEEEPVFGPPPLVPELLHEALEAYTRIALIDAGRAPERLQGEGDPLLDALNTLASCLLGHKKRRALFRWVRRGQSLTPILTDCMDDSPASCYPVSLWSGDPTLGLIGLTLGLPCEQWEEEATIDLQIGEQAFTIHTTRRLDGLYGPTLDLSWE